MKKTLLSIALLVAGFSAKAQLPDGSIAPNWTFTDINGTSHTLYDYLDDGYTVFIDVSAAWCGPCWSYHNTHALRDLYEQHGPAGFPDVDAGTTDDAMVFFIEGQLTNTAAQLTGTHASNTYAGASQGNWVAGTTYPIIDLPNNSAGQSFLLGYNIGYFPTIYKVCPNRIITEIGTKSASVLYASVSQCPPMPSSPADAAMVSYNTEVEICEGSAYIPKVTIQNNGTDPMTTATVSVTLNGTEVSTGTFNGNLPTFGFAEVTCSPIATPVAGSLVATVTTANDALAANGSVSRTLVIAPVANYSNATVKIATDAYGSETRWEIRNSSNVVVASGGPYSDQNQAGSFQQPDVNFTLVAGQCYKIKITDDYGDGFNSGYGNGYLKVLVNGTEMVSVTNFTTNEVIKKLATSNTLSIEDDILTDLSVYPNPASDLVHVSFEANGGDYAVSIIDLTGRVVVSKTLANVSGATHLELPIADLEAGNYFVSIVQGAATFTQKLIVK